MTGKPRGRPRKVITDTTAAEHVERHRTYHREYQRDLLAAIRADPERHEQWKAERREYQREYKARKRAASPPLTINPTEEK